MSDDDLDEFTQRRLRRDRAAARKHAIDQLKSVDPESIEETVEGGAQAYLDYKAEVALLTRYIHTVGPGAIHAVEAGLEREGASDGAVDPDALAEVLRASEVLAEKMIADRVAELEAPDLTLVVIPVDGAKPDDDHMALVALFARNVSELTDRAGIPAEMGKLQAALRELARPAVVYEMQDDYVHDFFIGDEGVVHAHDGNPDAS